MIARRANIRVLPFAVAINKHITAADRQSL